MRADVFFDAFSECLVGVSLARLHPPIRDDIRCMAMHAISDKHGPSNAEATGAMFDKLWSDMQKTGANK